MARNEAYVEAPPSAVWEVLEDPYAYPRWVVGSKRTVSADRTWPQPGSAFRVKVGAGPVSYEDRTESKEIEAGRRIVLNAGGGGWAGARVEILLQPSGEGTHVTLLEDPTGPAKPLRALPPLQLAIKLRNVESLRRLKAIVERRR
jgi:uncharacterized protein YndB with AHSA1/START domain